MLVAVPPLGKADDPEEVEVPEIVLEDVGSDSGDPLTLSQLIGEIVVQSVEQIIEKSGGKLPPELAGNIQGVLARLGALDKAGSDVKKSVEELGKRLTPAIDKATQGDVDGAKDSIENANSSEGLEKKLDGFLQGGKK